MCVHTQVNMSDLPDSSKLWNYYYNYSSGRPREFHRYYMLRRLNKLRRNPFGVIKREVHYAGGAYRMYKLVLLIIKRRAGLIHNEYACTTDDIILCGVENFYGTVIRRGYAIFNRILCRR